MLKKFFITIVLFISLFFIDQYIKFLFVDGYERIGECISLILVYNYGVAFSLFSFLEGNLKYIQIAIMLVIILYLTFNRDLFRLYYIPAALILAGGVSNIYDRFIHGGVVDYIYWHCGFDFAVFNFADVIIDIGVVLILFINYKVSKAKKITN
ncbi:MAG: signal peptidase II [Arcobacteraceae bacterium]|jgi:signal peptidase II